MGNVIRRVFAVFTPKQEVKFEIRITKYETNPKS